MTGNNIGDLLNKKGLSWGWFQGGFTPTTPYSGPTTRRDTTRRTAPAGRAARPATRWARRSAAPASTAQGRLHPAPRALPVLRLDRQPAPPRADLAVGGRHGHAEPRHGSRIQHGQPPVRHVDFNQLVSAIHAATCRPNHLPAVSYLKAPGYEDGHAGYSDPLDEQQFVTAEINALEQHARLVAHRGRRLLRRLRRLLRPRLQRGDEPVDSSRGHPDRRRRCGTGTPSRASRVAAATAPRLPLLVISPWAKTNFVDNTLTDQSSVVRFIEDNWRLPRIAGSSDSISGSLDDMFDFRGSTGPTRRCS